jgi:hypothetical protein
MGRGGVAWRRPALDVRPTAARCRRWQKLRAKSNVSPTPEMCAVAARAGPRRGQGGADVAARALAGDGRRAQGVRAEAQRRRVQGRHQEHRRARARQVAWRGASARCACTRVSWRRWRRACASATRSCSTATASMYVYVGRKATLKVAHKAKAVAEIIKAHERGGTRARRRDRPEGGRRERRRRGGVLERAGRVDARRRCPTTRAIRTRGSKRSGLFGDALYEWRSIRADIDNANVRVALLKTDNDKLSMQALSSHGRLCASTLAPRCTRGAARTRATRCARRCCRWASAFWPIRART